MRWLVLLSATSLFSSLARAESCAPLDLRSRFGEVRDQGTTDWCYGFAMADLLSFYLGKRVSAFDLSLRTFSQHNSPHLRELRERNAKVDASLIEYRRSKTPDSMAVAKREGVCEEIRVRSEGEIDEATVDDWIHEIEGLNRAGGPTVASRDQICNSAEFASAAHPTLSEGALGEALSADSKLETFLRLSERSCGGRRLALPEDLHYTISALSAKERASRDASRLLPTLTRILDRGEPAALQMDLSPFLKRSPGELVHVALVVGRQERAGQCHYLVRNSWGKSCHSYSRACESGHIWLSEQDLRSSAFYVGGMKPRGSVK